MTEYPYALTKNLGEQLMVHWSKVFKLSTIALRLFNVYGENQPKEFFIPDMINKVKKVTNHITILAFKTSL